MHCELCGREAELVNAIVEGVELNVCSDCARHGKLLVRPKLIISKSRIQEDEQVFGYVENYNDLIRKKREALGLKQEELAFKINEKASFIQKIESGHLKPSLNTAKKLQRFLKIKIIQELKEEKVDLKPAKTKEFTIGDFIKLKK